MFCFECNSIEYIKLNEILNKSLLVDGKFMPEMHLKQASFTYSACGPFTKSKERIEKFIQTGNTDFIQRNELDKASFQHDMAYGKSKDLAKKINQRDRVFKTATDPKYDGYQRGLALMVYNFIYKESSGSGVHAEPNQELANELHKQIIKKFKRRKVYSSLETICVVLLKLICNH